MSMLGVLRGPQQVLFGSGQRRALGTVAAALGGRALVCTDARFGSTREFHELVLLLEDAGMAVMTFAEVLPDVPVHQVRECAELATGFDPEVVIGMGGGSCLDLAKAVAVLLAHGGNRPTTTASSASRVRSSRSSPCRRRRGPAPRSRRWPSSPTRTGSSKVGISSPHLIPHTAICDPELTLGCPPALTASAGADALSHVIEAFTAIRRPVSADLATARVFVGKNELTDTFALLGVRLIASSLHRAWSSPDDVEAREAMMLGATAGGFALGTAGTAAAHAIQYPVGALTHTPHGIGVGVLLPYVMEFNRPARIPELALIALAMGASPDASPEDLADEAIDRVASLLSSVGVPATLAELGLPHDQLRWTAEQAMGAERLVANNPRLLDVDALEHIVRAAHAGDRAALRDSVTSSPLAAVADAR